MASKRMPRAVLTLVLIGLGVLAVRNLYLLSRDMLHGDQSAAQVEPQPINPVARIPDTAVTATYQAVNRIGSDFAQVYFPAQDVAHLQNAYSHASTLDPWGRPSRYAPAVILACSVTVCRLDYGPASLVHMLIQLVLFFFVAYWAFGLLTLAQRWPLSALAAGILLFLTPVGLSWFERGQFTLYVACSYTLFVVGLIVKKPMLVALSAVFAFVKWTAFPGIAVIGLTYVLASSSPQELRNRLLIVSPFPVVVACLFVLPILFSRGSGLFINGLITQELHENPTGLSLLKLAPRSMVKLLPVAFLLLGYIAARMDPGGTLHLIPIAIGVAAGMVIYPTRANDYSASILLGFVPLVMHWYERSRAAPRALMRVFVCGFAVFAVLSSFSTSVIHSLPAMIAAYLVFSLVYTAAPIILARQATPSPVVP